MDNKTKAAPKPEKAGLKIGDQVIPWSFVFQVKKECHGDWDTTIDCFWKARNAKGSYAVQRYIRKGLKPDQFGKRYMLLPSKEREAGKMDSIRQWFDKLYDRKKAPQSVCADLVALLAGKFGVPQ